MGNGDFKIILEALLDQTSLTDIEKKLAKKKIPLGIDFEFAKSIKDGEKQINEMAARFKDIFNLSDKDAMSLTKKYLSEANKLILQNEKATSQAEKSKRNEIEKTVSEYNKQQKAREKAESQNTKIRTSNVNSILTDEIQSLNKIADLRSKIVTQSSSGNTSQVSVLKDELSLEQQHYERLRNEISLYTDIISNEERRTVLKDATAQAELKIQQAQAKVIDTTNLQAEKSKTAELEMQAKLVEKIKAEQAGTTKRSINNDVLSVEKSYQSYEKLGLVTDKLKTDFEQLKLTKDALNNSSDADLAANYTKFNTALMTVNNTMKQTKLNTASVTSALSDTARLSKVSTIDTYMDNNSKAVKKYGKELRTISDRYKQLDSSMSKIESNKLEAEFKRIQNAARETGNIGLTALDKIKQGISKFGTWTIVSGIVMKTSQAMKDMVSNVIELDNSLLELSKVSDLSASGLADVTEEAYKLGETVGKTGRQVIDAVTEFKRAGFEINQSMTLAEDALKMVNVAEGIDSASESAKYLISIMKGYNDTSDEFATKILNSVNEVSNTRAVDFDNLVDGAQNLSAVADQANVSFEQMLGLLTGGYEVLGDMSKVSNGLITIFSRLQATDFMGDGEEVETVAKLQETFSNATKGVVNVVNQSTGQLRNAYDILEDLSGIWDTLDENTQSALAQSAAGIRQKNVFLSVVSNWNSVKESVESASDSIGSAEEENQKYLESINGKISQLDSSVEQLSSNVVDSGLIKFFIDLGTTGVNALNAIIGKIGLLGTAGLVGGGTGIVAFIKNLD